MEFENKLEHGFVNRNNESDDEINLRELYEKYIFSWKWVTLSVLFSLILAYVFLSFSDNKYEVTTTILINDEDSGGLPSELAAFKDLGILGTGKKASIINEIGVLKSRTLMTNTITELGLNISYYDDLENVNSELYGEHIPFKINFFVEDSIIHNLDTLFKIAIKSRSKFWLMNSDNDLVKEVDFGTNIQMNFGEINITPVNLSEIVIGETTVVKITPLKKVANYYREILEIEPEDVNSSLLILTLKENVKKKAQNILNELVTQYNNDAIHYKTLITRNTDRFINDRIIDISIDLTEIDKGIEEFKLKNKLTNIEFEAGLILTSNSELQKAILDLNSQIKLVNYVREHLANNSEQLIPSNLGIKDQETSTDAEIYNKLLLERNRIIKGSSVLNPTVINLDNQIQTLRQSISQSLTNLSSSLEISLTEARNEEYRLNSKRDDAPKQEREFQDIRRKQVIVEALYLYLLEKREENAISLGIPVPIAKIIDLADGSNSPIYPRPTLVYIIAISAGIILPLITIVFSSFIDNKVHTIEDVQAILNIPILGDIPKNKDKRNLVIADNKTRNISEAFRLLRTNINFMIQGYSDGGKVIFITSTIGNEGKTFIGINLATVLADANKKVLLIGADFRKPRISKYMNMPINNEGLTHFLSDYSLNISDFIISDKNVNFDIFPSGEVPPNPAELLMNDRFVEVINFGKENYDYVIVDTPPVSLVTDTLLIGHHANLFIYVIRANYLDKRLLKTPKMLYDNKRLPNMALLINSTDDKKRGYGYGY